MRVSLAAVAVLAVAGCSSSTPDAPASVQGLASKIGVSCASQTPTIGAREEAICGSHSSTDYVDLVTFANTAARDQWTKVAKAAGGVMVIGSDWAAITNTQDRAQAVVAKVGGTVS